MCPDPYLLGPKDDNEYLLVVEHNINLGNFTDYEISGWRRTAMVNINTVSCSFFGFDSKDEDEELVISIENIRYKEDDYWGNIERDDPRYDSRIKEYFKSQYDTTSRICLEFIVPTPNEVKNQFGDSGYTREVEDKNEFITIKFKKKKSKWEKNFSEYYQ